MTPPVRPPRPESRSSRSVRKKRHRRPNRSRAPTRPRPRRRPSLCPRPRYDRRRKCQSRCRKLRLRLQSRRPPPRCPGSPAGERQNRRLRSGQLPRLRSQSFRRARSPLWRPLSQARLARSPPRRPRKDRTSRRQSPRRRPPKSCLQTCLPPPTLPKSGGRSSPVSSAAGQPSRRSATFWRPHGSGSTQPTPASPSRTLRQPRQRRHFWLNFRSSRRKTYRRSMRTRPTAGTSPSPRTTSKPRAARIRNC